MHVRSCVHLCHWPTSFICLSSWGASLLFGHGHGAGPTGFSRHLEPTCSRVPGHAADRLMDSKLLAQFAGDHYLCWVSSEEGLLQ